MRPRRPTPLVLLAAFPLVLAACGTTDDTPSGGSTSPATGTDEEPGDHDGDEAVVGEEPVLAIVSTVAPIADVVAQVLGERGEVHTLVPPGTDSHTYEPRPSDVTPLAAADAFIGVGLDLNPASVALAEANLPEGAPLVLLAEEALDETDLSAEHWHEHDDAGHTHDDAGDHRDGQGGRHGGANPHVWTSVDHVIAFVEVIEATLTELDPDGTEHYGERAEAYRAELEELDAAIIAAVGTIDEGQRTLVVYHDAWAHFGRTYGVEVVAAVQPSDHAEPSASDVRAIIDQIREEDVPAVFGAEEFPTSVAETIADETGATYVGELADDTLPGEPGDPAHTYVGMMAENVARIVDALGGDASSLTELRP